jgi:hypothetical protein
VLLISQEIPFFSVRFSVREAPNDIAGNHTTTGGNWSKRKKCYRFLLPVSAAFSILISVQYIEAKGPRHRHLCAHPPELLGHNLREFQTCLTFQLVTETKVLQPREALTRTDDHLDGPTAPTLIECGSVK